MPRLARAFIDCSCYHVITRGNRRQTIFKKDKDYIKYLKMLKRAKKKYKILLYTYCIMPNHTHLLIETESANNMSKFMHWINRGYSAYFNCNYKTTGHLWQGRFKSKPILKGQYLIHCANYIEGNPVRAHLANDIANYQWSSYRERCLLSKKYILDDIVVDTRSSY